MIAQFKGEDRKQAIVNHFSLDIEEEETFFKYIKEMGYTIDYSDEIIESLYEMFLKNRTKYNKHRKDSYTGCSPKPKPNTG
jgi:hypothetical protein